jgi:hypothetical protein
MAKLSPMLNATKRKDGKCEYRTYCYKLSRDEILEVLEFLFTLRTPSCYSANIRSLVDIPGKKLNSMKSHDCHVMMTQILPVASRNVLPKLVRETLMRLCLFFNTISQKVINLDTLDGLQLEVVKTLYQLEMYSMSSFFDIMVHLIVHIVHEIKYCGLVFLHNMYPFEWYMGNLKHYCGNRYRPEASIVEGYTAEEVVAFCIDYMSDQRPMGVPRSLHEGRLAGVGLMGLDTTSPSKEMFDA